MVAGSGADPGIEAELPGALADGVCVVAPDGLIVWANAAMSDLMGESIDDLIGNDGLAMVHPDDLARAIDGIDYAQQFPGRTAVAPFRIRTGHHDGWIDVEVKTGVLSRADGDYLTIVVRDATARRAVHQALQSVAAGEPLATTVDLVGTAVMGRWPNSALAVVLPQPDGGHEVQAVGLAGELVEHAKGLRRGPDGLAPWELARGAEPVVVIDAADLEPDVAAAAAAQGFAGFGVAPVRNGAGGDGCLIAWFDHVIIARLEFFHAAPELTEVLSIALGRHNLHREMWAAARRDALTGLLNRFGFTGAFETCVQDARADGSVVAVVYYIDLDGLKAVNDVLGHAAGDGVLVELARRLDGACEAGIAARLGGDEFALVVHVPAGSARESACRLADDLVGRLAIEHDPPVSASIGLVVDDGVTEPLALLERADAAMYRAKESGKARWSL